MQLAIQSSISTWV